MGYKKNEGEDEGNKIIMMMLMHHHYYLFKGCWLRQGFIAYTPYTLRFISYFLDDAIHYGEDFG